MQSAFAFTPIIATAMLGSTVSAQSPRANDQPPRVPQVTTQPVQQPPRRLEGIVVHEPPSRPCGGATFVGAVVLKQLVPQPPAVASGSGDVIVTLQSSRPDIARVPDVVRIPPGEQAGRFEVTTVPLTAQGAYFKVVARLANEVAETNPVGIRGPRISNVYGSPGGDCDGGETPKFTAQFDCPAPSSGLRFHFSGSGKAHSTEIAAVKGGDSVSDKVSFSRCCGASGTTCHWSVTGHLSADGTHLGSRSTSGTCGQPDSCPN
ncbi:MAG: hypothetical protein ACRETT_05955 [Steroidobacteraceae bacterium]